VTVTGPAAQAVGVGTSETRAVRRDPPALRFYSQALLAAGLAVGAVALVVGAPLPPVLPTVLLVTLMAVATNRIALFPSEWSATAEATVLVAAVVAFAPDSALLGPWVVALACGPLDVVHDRRTGLVVPPEAAAVGQAVAWLREHEDEAAALGAAGKALADEVTWDRAIARLLS